MSELSPEEAISTFAATPPLESLGVMLSRYMTGASRQPADVRVLRFHDISRAPFHGKARRTIVIKVPREDGECESGYAVLDKAMFGTEDAAQCFDVACEDAMTAMRFSTEVFSPLPFNRHWIFIVATWW